MDTMRYEYLLVEASRPGLDAATDDRRAGTRAFVATRKPEVGGR
jgi:hypothetical protein